MMFIDLNCDMAEGLSHDAELMPFISSANIACGYHAGDETLMKQTVDLAIEHGVAIGAHPGFADREHFGRTEMQLPIPALIELVQQQVWQLKAIAAERGTRLHHVKPHGALYNMAARDVEMAEAVAEAVYGVDASLLLFGLSGSCSIDAATRRGLRTVSEVFADRTYQSNGALTPRSQPHALINNEDDAIQQVLQMIRTGSVTSVDGNQVPIVAETVCLHGDGAHAVTFARKIFHTLQAENIGIKSF